MPELPQIVNPTPIVEPASEERTYDSKYIIGMGYLDNGTVAKLNIEFRPYDYTNKVINFAGPKSTLTVSDVWAAAAEVPLFAQAMGLVTQCAALMDIRNYLETQIAAEEAKAEPDLEVLDGLNGQLVTVYESLGIELVDGTE